MRKIDRTRTLAQQQCPRRRFLNYEWGGRGVARPQPDLALAVGIATHTGVGALLLKATEDDAVAQALADWPREAFPECAGEQAALIEAMVRVHSRVCLPALLEEFDVVGVEREMEMALTPELVWMARADAELRHRGTGELYVYSLKTAKMWTTRNDQEARLDMQGVSELAALEHVSGERVGGVVMHYLLKGDRSKKSDWLQDSALVRPWRRVGQFGVEWAWTNAYPCAEPAKCKYHAKRPSDNPYHKLGDEWERVNIWEYMTVREWIDMLDSGVSQTMRQLGSEPEVLGGPGALAAQVVTPMPYHRVSDDVGEWREETTAQEERVAAAVQRVEQAVGTPEFELVVRREFPRHRRACLWPARCPYLDDGIQSGICGGVRGALTDPLSAGYVYRTPHHAGETDE